MLQKKVKARTGSGCNILKRPALIMIRFIGVYIKEPKELAPQNKKEAEQCWQVLL